MHVDAEKMLDYHFYPDESSQRIRLSPEKMNNDRVGPFKLCISPQNDELPIRAENRKIAIRPSLSKIDLV